MSQKKKTICSAVGFLCIAAVIVCAGELVPRTSMFRTVLQLGAIYALLAVSMNLCNGFTGLFSLGQACQGLCKLNPKNTAKTGQYKNQRKEKDPLPAHGKKGGASGLPGALQRHIRGRGDPAERHDQTLRPQSEASKFDNHRIIFPESHHDLWGKNKNNQAEHRHHHSTDNGGKAYGFMDSAVFFSPVIKTGHRLEALSEAQHRGKHKEHEPSYDTHSSHGGIPV